MTSPRTKLLVFLLSAAALALPPKSRAQQDWSSSNQQDSPDGAVNSIRTRESHTEVNGRVADKTSVQTLGPDGNYIPYSETEKESHRINDTTIRTIERTYGRDSDGQRVLIQEMQEESRSLPAGEQRTTRTLSDPDADGTLQVMRRELEDSKQLSPSVTVTNTTVLTPDMNGGFAPAVRTEERDTKTNDGAVEFKKSTMLSDGTGGWKLSEVRQGTTKEENGKVVSKNEQVLCPDSEGKLSVVQQTVSKQSQNGSGNTGETTDTYSTNVPGVAGDDSLQLVKRETAVRSKTATGAERTVQEVERQQPGETIQDLHVAQEAIDIVRPGSNGNADQTRTILLNSDGQLGQVWVDTGKTDNPAAVKVDTSSPAPPKK
ncbi:MAG: hypothetical protein WAM79_10670 [Candidatus Sulfotelmatobacter sp.]